LRKVGFKQSSQASVSFQTKGIPACYRRTVKTSPQEPRDSAGEPDPARESYQATGEHGILKVIGSYDPDDGPPLASDSARRWPGFLHRQASERVGIRRHCEQIDDHG